MSPRKMTRPLATLTLVVLAAACARNPVTGEREITLVSESQEIQMGQQGYEQVAQSIGLVEDEALQAYVQGIGEDLARDSERPDLPWTFRILEDPTPNAFAFPGGFIFVTRGLLTYMDSEAELAAVLGHEIGHVTAKHSVSQISRAQLAQLGLGLGMILFPEAQSLGGLFSSGLQLLFLKYGRDDERQADELGFRYALQQRYDVAEADDVFITLQRIGERQGRSPLPSWASTHPDPGERIEAARARQAEVDAAGALRLDKPEFLGHLDGLVFGENPRAGFFEDNVFLHPDLRFRLTFPRGWRTQNMSQAVVAGSPENDAAIQLTLVQAEPARAAQQFVAQEGVQAGRMSRQTINGLPGVIASFQAQTQSGVVQGLAGFVSHGGRTYQILTYSPAQRYPTYDRLFQQVIGSFGPLTDPAALAVQPQRIDIVEIPTAMTLVQFNQRYPSAVGLDELALLNQVADASVRLPAGSLVKRVVGR